MENQRKSNQRKAVRELVAREGINLSQLSKAVEMSHSYFQQYLGKKGSPEELPEPVRIKLSERYGIDPEALRQGKLSQLAANPTRKVRPTMTIREEPVSVEEIRSYRLQDEQVLIQFLDSSGIRFEVILPIEEIRRFRTATQDY